MTTCHMYQLIMEFRQSTFSIFPVSPWKQPHPPIGMNRHGHNQPFFGKLQFLNGAAIQEKYSENYNLSLFRFSQHFSYTDDNACFLNYVVPDVNFFNYLFLGKMFFLVLYIIDHANVCTYLNTYIVLQFFNQK